MISYEISNANIIFNNEMLNASPHKCRKKSGMFTVNSSFQYYAESPVSAWKVGKWNVIHIDYKGKNLTVIILIDMILFIEYHKKSGGEKASRTNMESRVIGYKTFSGERIIIFNEWLWKSLGNHMGKTNLYLWFTTYTKSNSKWIIFLNV